MATGHARKRGKTWSVVIELPRDPATGKRRQEWKGGFRTKKEAEAYKVARQREVDTGVAVEPSRQTFLAYLTDWIAKRRDAGRIEQTTFEEYGRMVRNQIAPWLGTLAVAQLTPAHIDAWLARLRRDELGQHRIRAAYALVHGGLDAAVRLRLIAVNPCDGVEPPRVKESPRPIWDEAQVARFRRLIRGNPFEALYLLALATGLRQGELLGLRWSDVDLARGELAVAQQARYSVADKYHYADPKTDDGARRLSIPGFALAALRAYRAGREEDEGIVFLHENGRPLRKYHVNYAWTRLARRLAGEGLPPITFHDLRHINATIALAAGVSPKTVSARLGHASVRFTLDRYGHVTKGMDHRAAEQIDAAFGGAGGGGEDGSSG